MFSRTKSKEKQALNMRQYLQYHLDLYGLGRLVSIKGPNRGGKNKDQSWFELTLIYEPPGVTDHLDNVYMERVFIGYRNNGGYWNRRNLRIAIEREAERVRLKNRPKVERDVIPEVWKSAQLAITDGSESSNPFTL